MTDAQFKEQKLRVNKFLDKWQKPAGFGWWDIAIEYDRERDENPSTLGKCWSNWQYRTAAITFYLPTLMDNTDDEVEAAVVHELSHILLAPIQDLSNPEKAQITEYATSCVAKALLWAHYSVKKGTRNGKAQKTPNKAQANNEQRELRPETDATVSEDATV